jgi:hypothetical protein
VRRSGCRVRWCDRPPPFRRRRRPGPCSRTRPGSPGGTWRSGGRRDRFAVLALCGRRRDELLDSLRARRGGAPRRLTSTVRVPALCRWPNVSVRSFSPPHSPLPVARRDAGRRRARPTARHHRTVRGAGAGRAARAGIPRWPSSRGRRSGQSWNDNGFQRDPASTRSTVTSTHLQVTLGIPTSGAHGSAAQCQAAAKLRSISARAGASVAGHNPSASPRAAAASRSSP